MCRGPLQKHPPIFDSKQTFEGLSCLRQCSPIALQESRGVRFSHRRDCGTGEYHTVSRLWKLILVQTKIKTTIRDQMLCRFVATMDKEYVDLGLQGSVVPWRQQGWVGPLLEHWLIQHSPPR